MSLREIAKQEVTLSPLMDGREKITTSEIIKKFPKGFTIGAADLIETDSATYAIVVPQEDTGLFYTGGLVLTKIVKQWLAVEPNKAELAKMLQQEKIKVVLSEEKTRDGKNNITTVKIE